MSTQFRSPRISRSYLARIAQEVASPAQLAPDIITDRSRPAASDSAAHVPVRPRRPAITGADLSIVEERHPDIAKAISLLWGFPEMNEYFARLWIADGSHGPIDPDAMSELMLLARLHQSITPRYPGRSLAAIYGSDRLFDATTGSPDPWIDVPPRR